jgi:hypothetical protein
VPGLLAAIHQPGRRLPSPGLVEDLKIKIIIPNEAGASPSATTEPRLH